MPCTSLQVDIRTSQDKDYILHNTAVGNLTVCTMHWLENNEHTLTKELVLFVIQVIHHHQTGLEDRNGGNVIRENAKRACR